MKKVILNRPQKLNSLCHHMVYMCFLQLSSFFNFELASWLGFAVLPAWIGRAQDLILDNKRRDIFTWANASATKHTWHESWWWTPIFRSGHTSYVCLSVCVWPCKQGTNKWTQARLWQLGKALKSLGRAEKTYRRGKRDIRVGGWSCSGWEDTAFNLFDRRRKDTLLVAWLGRCSI